MSFGGNKLFPFEFYFFYFWDFLVFLAEFKSLKFTLGRRYISLRDRIRCASRCSPSQTRIGFSSSFALLLLLVRSLLRLLIFISILVLHVALLKRNIHHAI